MSQYEALAKLQGYDSRTIRLGKFVINGQVFGSYFRVGGSGSNRVARVYIDSQDLTATQSKIIISADGDHWIYNKKVRIPEKPRLITSDRAYIFY